MLGFLLGGLVGATVALLSAPQSGAETRAIIRNKTGELRDRATDVASDTRDRDQKMITSARSQATDVAQKARDRVSEVVQRGQGVVQKTQS